LGIVITVYLDYEDNGGDIRQPFKWHVLFHTGRLNAGLSACLFTFAHDGKMGAIVSLRYIDQDDVLLLGWWVEELARHCSSPPRQQ
jgi:hypothetical protein